MAESQVDEEILDENITDIRLKGNETYDIPMINDTEEDNQNIASCSFKINENDNDAKPNENMLSNSNSTCDNYDAFGFSENAERKKFFDYVQTRRNISINKENISKLMKQTSRFETKLSILESELDILEMEQNKMFSSVKDYLPKQDDAENDEDMENDTDDKYNLQKFFSTINFEEILKGCKYIENVRNNLNEIAEEINELKKFEKEYIARASTSRKVCTNDDMDIWGSNKMEVSNEMNVKNQIGDLFTNLTIGNDQENVHTASTSNDMNSSNEIDNFYFIKNFNIEVEKDLEVLTTNQNRFSELHSQSSQYDLPKKLNIENVKESIEPSSTSNKSIFKKTFDINDYKDNNLNIGNENYSGEVRNVEQLQALQSKLNSFLYESNNGSDPFAE